MLKNQGYSDDVIEETLGAQPVTRMEKNLQKMTEDDLIQEYLKKKPEQ